MDFALLSKILWLEYVVLEYSVLEFILTLNRYYNKEDALECMKYINGTKLDERFIRTDIDKGFVEGTFLLGDA